MAAMDEFREEREAVKNGTLGQKLSYFWDYYKWHTIVIIAVLIAIISLIHNIVTKKDNALTGILLNAYQYDIENTETNLVDKFIKEANIDTSECEVSLNTGLSYMPEDEAGGASYNYSTSQVINAQAGAGELDFVTGTHSAMNDWAYKGLFLDLREIMTPEQIAFYESYFIYMDQAVVEKRAEAWDKMEDTTAIPIPDSSKPETMEKPIPVMIDMTTCQKLLDAYGYEIETLAFGVTANAPNQETALAFLDFLIK